MKVDTTLLPTLLSGDANICIILTRKSDQGSYHKYYCNGEASLAPFETWSSSKIFAMANAASSLRNEGSCEEKEYGLDASTTGDTDRIFHVCFGVTINFHQVKTEKHHLGTWPLLFALTTPRKATHPIHFRLIFTISVGGSGLTAWSLRG